MGETLPLRFLFASLEVLDEPMILREEPAGTREVLMDGLRKHDISPDMLDVAMVLGNAEAIEKAVEEGPGIAFVSCLAAARGLELGRVVEVEVEGMELTRKVYLARNRKHSLTRAQVEFWQFISDSKEQIGSAPNKLQAKEIKHKKHCDFGKCKRGSRRLAGNLSLNQESQAINASGGCKLEARLRGRQNANQPREQIPRYRHHGADGAIHQ